MSLIKTISIFTDAATCSQTSLAIGAFLYFDQDYRKKYADYDTKMLTSELSKIVIYKQYNSRKSTWSEISTAIDALEFIQKSILNNFKIEIFTDCKSLCDLLGPRKEKLLEKNFMTRKGKILENAGLYKELFKIIQGYQIQVYKIKAHPPSSKHLTLQERIFDILDKLSRKKLINTRNVFKSNLGNNSDRTTGLK